MKNVYRDLLRSVSVLTFLLGAFAVAHAQQRLITGTVKDVSGGTMPGVNVLIKGTTNGTATDADGSFSIQAANEDVLVFSFIGYSTSEVLVGTQSSIDVTLEEDLTTLGEVVVIGYGVQKKILNTGANLQVKGEDLQKQNTTFALQALQGQAPGVQITSTSGQPGEGLKVRIRGVGTIGNANPLFVVDGVYTGDISYLNPADIESIDVLKDAASAAIYGSQAANGVVLITTKKGKSGGAAQITFDAFYGVQNVARKVDLLDATEYATIMNEAAVNSGKLPYFTPAEIAELGTGTNWIDEMFVRDAPTQNYSFGVSGGTDMSTYSTSLSYLSQAGIVGGADLSNYERYSFRINSEHKVYKDIIKVGQNLTFSYVNKNGIGVGNQYNNTLRSAFNTSPFVPMYDDEGNFWDNSESDWFNGEANPYAQMVYNNQNESNDQKLLGNLFVEVEPLKGLKLRSTVAIDYYANESHSFTPVYTLSIYSYNNVTRTGQSMGKGHSWMWDNLASYSFDIGNGHHFDAMIGSSAYRSNGTYLFGNNTNLVFNDLRYAYLSNATNTEGINISLGGGPNDEVNLMSYFGRLNYNFNETYMINATLRADGSSRFIGNNRWGYFPSVSAGWVMSNAAFMSSVDWVNFFKLRASWGQVGNQNIGNFQYLAPVRFSTTNYIFGETEGVLTPGAYVSRLANPNVKWEASEQTNIGFDARFLDGRLDVSLDLYNKTSRDWLIAAPVLATAGADAPFINGGNVINKGIELALSYSSNVGELNYTISTNGAYNKNEVSEIPTADGIIHGQTNQLFDNSGEFYRAQTGFPIGYFWGLQTDGIFQTEEEVLSYRSNEGDLIQPSARPGDVRYVDRDGNGEINDLDKTMIGNPNPDFTFGFSISASYKGFDLLVQGNGVAGNELVQTYRNHANTRANYTSAILERWHGPGSSNDMPRVTENANNWVNFSDLYIHKGDFLRLSTVTLGYDFTHLMGKKFMNQCRLYVSGLNLLTLTKYEGMDPEIGYGIDSYSSGTDISYYPRPRTLLVGLNVKF